MKNIFVALVLLFTLPAAAEKANLSAVASYVRTQVPGYKWETTKCFVSGTFTGVTLTWQVSTDGTNVTSGAYAKQVDFVGTPPIALTATDTGTYEFPISEGVVWAQAYLTSIATGPVTVQCGPGRPRNVGNSISDVVVSGTLANVGDAVTVALSGRMGCGYSVPVGFVGTIMPKFSFDGGLTFFSSLDNPSIIHPLVTNTTSGTLLVPGGATHAQLVVTAATNGFCVPTLRATASSGTSRGNASGTLSAATASVTSTTGNFVALPIDPTRWASATLTFSSGAFTGTLMWDMMINGQWVAAPYATLTSTASANPATVASKDYAGAVADTWDLPLPGNITAVRVRSSAVAANSVVATLTPGRPRGAVAPKRTYTASLLGLVPVAGATDIWAITGSNSATVEILRVTVTGTQTTGGAVNIALIKRSTADGADGGTPSSPSLVPLDTISRDATATVYGYPYLPALGASAGYVDIQGTLISATTAGGDMYVWPPMHDPVQALTLHGTSEVAAISLGGATLTGGALNLTVIWTETP